jgi:hypothetical protein
MTEKQIEKIRLSIKKHRTALTTEKRKYGGYDDSAGRRYYISELYMQIADYKGAITYKKWFDKNFPDDIGGPILSLNWSIAFHSLNQIADTKIYTIDTAFQNVYLHRLLLNKEVHKIDMYEDSYNMLEYAQSLIDYCRKVVTKPYLDWLSSFIESEDYQVPINRFIALNKLLKDEDDTDKRIELIDYIRNLETMNKNPKK